MNIDADHGHASRATNEHLGMVCFDTDSHFPVLSNEDCLR